MLGPLLMVQYSTNYIPRYYSHLHTLVSKLVHVFLYNHLSSAMVLLVVLDLAFVRRHPTMIHLLWMLYLPLFPTMMCLPKYSSPFPSLVDNNGRHPFQPSFHMLGIQ